VRRPRRPNPDEPLPPPPDHDDVAQKLRRLKTLAGWRRDCASSIALGGGSVTIALPLGNLTAYPAGYAALGTLLVLLLVAHSAADALIDRVIGQPWRHTAAGFAKVAAFAFVLSIKLWGDRWPIRPGSLNWYILIGYAATMGVAGILLRNKAAEILTLELQKPSPSEP
jgi:hypothetical protein